ncbi:protein yellow-like isoform X2 [Cloeon dipterum]|uniref:protein yellow-like isoform X2 n=1 Tax=Cloeon dipterum TaxID=197152 RepID=UPI003220918F
MVGSMTPSLVAIFLLGFSSLATAANFNQVYQWNELDFEWPSEESRAQALKNETFKLENIYPRYMAVYGTRIFLSTYHSYANPVSLVSLPMSSAFSASPKLTPVPSWDMHGKEGDCDKIERAKGIDVDSVGRLWLLDMGCLKCNIIKLWTIDLANNDQTKLVHQFPFHSLMHDLVVDETANETFVYISRGGLFYEEQIVVFSLERNESWIVQTPGIKVFCIALSPLKNQEPRQLYLGEWSSSYLHSINSVAVLREGTGTANTEKIGTLTAHPYRILVENNGNMLAAFFSVNYISSWNTSQSFAEKRFHEVDVLNSGKSFTFALDQNGTLWMTVFDAVREPKYRLLKAAVGEQSLQATPELHVATAASGGVQSRILMNSSLFFVFLLALF